MPYLELPSYVNDFTNSLDSEIIEIYNKSFSEYNKKEWVQVTTVFIKHREWRELKEIALEIFNENWIWDEHTNSGLLLIVVTEEKKIRIMTGKWMELEFPDSYCRDIIEWELRPLLNKWYIKLILESWYEILSQKRDKNTRHSYQDYSSLKSQFTNEMVWDVSWILLKMFKLFFYVFLWFFLTWVTVAGIHHIKKLNWEPYTVKTSTVQSNTHASNGSWDDDYSWDDSDNAYDSGDSDDSDWWWWSSNGWGWGD